MKKKTGKSFVALGAILLIGGFVQQGFTINFGNGILSLGFIFLISGVCTILYCEQKQEE